MGEVDAEAGVGQGREGTRLDELVLLQVGWEEHASGGRRGEAQVVGVRRQQGKTGCQPLTACSPDRWCYVPERLRIMADLISEWGSQIMEEQDGGEMGGAQAASSQKLRVNTSESRVTGALSLLFQPSQPLSRLFCPNHHPSSLYVHPPPPLSPLSSGGRAMSDQIILATDRSSRRVGMERPGSLACSRGLSTHDLTLLPPPPFIPYFPHPFC